MTLLMQKITKKRLKKSRLAPQTEVHNSRDISDSRVLIEVEFEADTSGNRRSLRRRKCIVYDN